MPQIFNIYFYLFFLSFFDRTSCRRARVRAWKLVLHLSAQSTFLDSCLMFLILVQREGGRADSVSSNAFPLDGVVLRRVCSPVLGICVFVECKFCRPSPARPIFHCGCLLGGNGSIPTHLPLPTRAPNSLESIPVVKGSYVFFSFSCNALFLFLSFHQSRSFYFRFQTRQS